jgi:hypothetical protein
MLSTSQSFSFARSFGTANTIEYADHVTATGNFSS